MPAIYERDGEDRLVEYDWSPIAFGREYFELDDTTVPSEEAALKMSRGLVPEIVSEAIRIEQVCPLTLIEFLRMTGDPEAI